MGGVCECVCARLDRHTSFRYISVSVSSVSFTVKRWKRRWCSRLKWRGVKRSSLFQSATAGEGQRIAWPALKLTLTQAASAIWRTSKSKRVVLCLRAYCTYTPSSCTPFSNSSAPRSETWPEKVRKRRFCSSAGPNSLRSGAEEHNVRAMAVLWTPRRESLHCCSIMHQVPVLLVSRGCVGAVVLMVWRVVLAWRLRLAPLKKPTCHRNELIHSWDLIPWIKHAMSQD